LPAKQTLTGEGTDCNVSLAAKSALWLLVPRISMERSSVDVTLLLKRYSNGDQNALAELIPQIYDELRRLASCYLQGERIDHTLQTTALVHEAYFRLVDQKQVEWSNRNHFFGVAAQMMRRILVDHARKHHAFKRGSSWTRVSLDQAEGLFREQPQQLIALDDLLTRLASLDPEASRIVDLRFFAGLSLEETAEVMGLSTAKVRREWSVAKAWFTREMGKLNGTEPRELGE
jgi:RNA polymerase sigma factor (TIGR02999 family)